MKKHRLQEGLAWVCFKCGKKILFVIGGIHRQNRYKCKNSDAAYKNGNYRIIDRDIIYNGKIPDWCPLEDYENANNQKYVS